MEIPYCLIHCVFLLLVRAQVTSFNIDPKQFDIIVAKGVNAPIAAYNAICPTIIAGQHSGCHQG